MSQFAWKRWVVSNLDPSRNEEYLINAKHGDTEGGCKRRRKASTCKQRSEANDYREATEDVMKACRALTMVPKGARKGETM